MRLEEKGSLAEGGITAKKVLMRWARWQLVKRLYLVEQEDWEVAGLVGSAKGGAARLQRGKDENAEGDEKEFKTSALDAKVATLDSSPIRSSWLYTTAIHCWA